MSEYRELGKNTVMFALGGFGSRAISILLLPVLTRFLSQEEYGQIDIILTTVSLLAPAITMMISNALFRFLLDSVEAGDKRKLLTTSLFIALAGYSLFLLISPVFISFRTISDYFTLFVLIIFSSRFEVITRSFIRGEKQLFLYAVSEIVHTLLFASTAILFVWSFQLGVKGYLMATLVSQSTTALIVFCFGKLYRHIGIHSVSVDLAKKMLNYSIPLVPNEISWWIMNVSDRYMLTYFVGLASTGIYSVSYKFPTLLTFVYAVFNQAWQISAVKIFSGNDRNSHFETIFRYLSTIVILSLSVFGVLLKPLVWMFTGEEFRISWIYVPSISLGVLFMIFSHFFGVAYNVSKRTIGALRTTLIAAAVNILVNLSLIPVMGVQAAAISTFIAYLVLWIIRIIETRRYIQPRIGWSRLVSSLSICSGILFANYLKLNGFLVQLFLLSALLVIQKHELSVLLDRCLKSVKRRIRS